MQYEHNYNNNLSLNNIDIYNSLPRSFQLMLDIEREADAIVKQILQDIEAGITTLDEVLLERGISL